ncbi:MAG: hypothetical protein WC954_02925 [Sphaerochaeta sp.]
MNKRYSSLLITVTLLLILSSGGLFADVHVTYTPATTIYLIPSPGAFTHPTMVGAQLGHFEVWSDNGFLYTPALTVSPDAYHGSITMTGLYSWTPPSGAYIHTSLAFNVVFLSYRKGTAPANGVLSQAWGEPRVGLMGSRVNQEATQALPLLIDVYLINSNIDNGVTGAATSGTPAQGFFLHTAYTFNNPFNPSFGFAVADQPDTDIGTYLHGSTVSSTPGQSGTFVEVNGVDTGHETIPILNPGAIDGDGEMYYVEEPPEEAEIHTFFSLESNTVPITLSQFTGQQVRKINTAILEVEVTHPQGGEKANVDVVFTDDCPPGLSGFHLLHLTPGPSIPYNLYWGNQTTQISKGQPIPWNGLGAGIHRKDIYMGRINANTAASAAEGQYKACITVTIINRD